MNHFPSGAITANHLATAAYCGATSSVTLDGRKGRVLHPGFKNHEAGPDFRGAMVQIDGEPPRQGDVEVDLRSSGWRAHGHDRNPAFKNVVLHVVWKSRAAGIADIPVIALHDQPGRAACGQLDAWLGRDSLKTLPDELLGQCCGPLRDLPPEKLTRTAASRRGSPVAGQGGAIPGAGAADGLGTGIVGGLVSRARLQAKRLADAQPRGMRDLAMVLALRAPAGRAEPRVFDVGGLLPDD